MQLKTSIARENSHCQWKSVELRISSSIDVYRSTLLHFFLFVCAFSTIRDCFKIGYCKHAAEPTLEELTFDVKDVEQPFSI